MDRSHLKIHLALSLSILLLLSGLQGCVFSSGDPSDGFLNKQEAAQRERIEPAVLRVAETQQLDERYRKSVRIVGVDGETRGFMQNKVALRPGKHSVTVLLESELKSENNPDLTELASIKANLAFEVEPGELYELHGLVTRDEVWLWIARERDSLVISGAKPKS